MLFDPKFQHCVDRLEARLGRARTPTPELMSAVIAETRGPLSARGEAATTHLRRLIESGAWTDAALALVQLELPQWRFRRIVYEDGEWHCSLSREPQLPPDFDDVADGQHEALQLAMRFAFLQARRDAAVGAVDPAAKRRAGSPGGDPMCCDNFA
jgi:hypothetical protein